MTFRVCLAGAESTGKSTLSLPLAAHFGGVVVREYGRTWAELNGTDFTPSDLRIIADGQISVRMGAELAEPTMIVEDTDIVMTTVWSRMLFGVADPFLKDLAATADLYLLFAPDMPWIDDGTRLFGGDRRQRFHDAIVAELAEREIEPVLIGGSWDARLAAAIAAVDARLHHPGGRSR